LATPVTGAAPVFLCDVDGYPVNTGREGDAFMASCTIAVADTTAADAAIFSMRVASGAKRAYVKSISGSLIFSATASADGEQGVYFERHSGRLQHSGGTAITPVALESSEQSAAYDIRFHTGALTATGVDYEGGKFSRTNAAISATGVTVPFYFAYEKPGVLLRPGQGLAMRLTYQAVAGLFIALNVEWTEVDG
jgi:hypothetical protein